MNTTSTCTKCKLVLPIDFFSVKKSGAIYKRCKDCTEKVMKSKSRKPFKEYIKKYDAKNWERRLVITCRKIDSLKSHAFDVDIEWIRNQCKIQDNKCAHCKEVLSFDMVPGNRKKPSVDRIDNSLGHLKTNCLISCINCNLLRGDMDIDRFRNRLEAKKRERETIKWIMSDDEL